MCVQNVSLPWAHFYCYLLPIMNLLIHKYVPIRFVAYCTAESNILPLTHIPNCPSGPSLHSKSICMSKAAESLRRNQPQRHSLSAQRLPGAAAASSAFGGSKSQSLHRSPMGGEESSYSNSMENASTHRGTVTHSWDSKYQRETRHPPANWEQSMDLFLPFTNATKLIHPKKPMNLFLCFRGTIWMSESVCHVIQDVVYRTAGRKWMGWNSEGLWDAFSGRQASIEALRLIIHTAHSLDPVWIYYTI